MEIWYKVYCICGAPNWVYGGDVSDITDFEVRVFRCWECEMCNMMDYECNDELTEEEMEEEAEEGLKKPR